MPVDIKSVDIPFYYFDQTLNATVCHRLNMCVCSIDNVYASFHCGLCVHVIRSCVIMTLLINKSF